MSEFMMIFMCFAEETSFSPLENAENVYFDLGCTRLIFSTHSLDRRVELNGA